MARGIVSRRGRTPSISTAARRARDLKKSLRALVREVGQLEARLEMLDRFFRSREKMLRASRRGAESPGAGLRGRGPNIRDVAHEILSRQKKPMNIALLADKVLRQKGGKAGANFVQNLGAALYRDKRFRRTGRGLYGLR